MVIAFGQGLPLPCSCCLRGVLPIVPSTNTQRTTEHQKNSKKFLCTAGYSFNHGRITGRDKKGEKTREGKTGEGQMGEGQTAKGQAGEELSVKKKYMLLKKYMP